MKVKELIEALRDVPLDMEVKFGCHSESTVYETSRAHIINDPDPWAGDKDIIKVFMIEEF